MQCIDLDFHLRQTDPFRFVDEVSFCEIDNVIQAVKFYIGDEEFFEGHFPGDPVVPGVILVESMAQCCRAWLNKCVGRKAEGFIASIDRVKFLKPVRPGDVVIVKAKPEEFDMQAELKPPCYRRFSCSSYVGGEKVAKAALMLYQSA